MGLCRRWRMSIPGKRSVVELRFFAGLSVDETAAVLKVSPQTVLRDWSLSKTWLAAKWAAQPANLQPPHNNLHFFLSAVRVLARHSCFPS